ncbi:MAG: AI-2E family transporter [Bacteroidales bacterium]
MSGSSIQPENHDGNYVKTAIDLILKIGSLFLVVYLCIRILNPFLSMLVWGLVIAIILFPLFLKLDKWLGNKKKLSSLILTLVLLSLVVLPSIWLVNQMIDGIKYLAGSFEGGELKFPVPPDSVKEWPLIGPWLFEKWTHVARNFGEAIKGFLPQLTGWIEKLLGTLANTGLGILQFAASIILAGIFLLFFKEGADSGRKVFNKIVGERGEEFMLVSLQTIRNVATGVLGVAIIQSALMGVGMIFSGIPLAGVWIIVVLIMAIAQLPVLLFNIPLIIYLFAFKDPLPAVVWTVYFLAMGMIDNILKPIFMGKGSDVPMLVIFLGTIGGFIAFGFIGLFLGSIILSLAYKLYITWISSPAGESL